MKVKSNQKKNSELILSRGISFELVEEKLRKRDILDIRSHPNKKKYPHQQIFVIEHRGYVYYLPFVDDNEGIFLKTVIPSRKLTKEFRHGL